MDDAVVAQCRALRDEVTRGKPLPLDDLKAWANWLPFLANRAPFLDLPSCRAPVERRVPDGRRPHADCQPWSNFSFAASCAITCFGDVALQEIETGLLMISGLGCLDESLCETRGGGFAPYPPGAKTFAATLCITDDVAGANFHAAGGAPANQNGGVRVSLDDKVVYEKTCERWKVLVGAGRKLDDVKVTLPAGAKAIRFFIDAPALDDNVNNEIVIHNGLFQNQPAAAWWPRCCSPSLTSGAAAANAVSGTNQKT